MYSFINKGYANFEDGKIVLTEDAPRWAEEEYRTMIEDIENGKENRVKLSGLQEYLKDELISYISSSYNVYSDIDLEDSIEEILLNSFNERKYMLIECEAPKSVFVTNKVLGMNMTLEEAKELLEEKKTEHIECYDMVHAKGAYEDFIHDNSEMNFDFYDGEEYHLTIIEQELIPNGVEE